MEMVTPSRHRGFSALGAILWGACVLIPGPGGAQAADPAAAKGHHPAAPAGVGSLDVFATGNQFHLLLARTLRGEPPGLFYFRSEDAGRTWLPRVRIDTAAPHNPHRGMDAQIAATNQVILAAWMIQGTGLFGSGPIALARSTDGGKTWAPGASPLDDRSTAGHSFLDLAADNTGVFHLTWLDSRDGQQGVRYTRSSDGGKTWEPNQTLKAASCECCWNTLATGDAGEVAVLFRDKNPRDMRVAFTKDGGAAWQVGAPAGSFGWQFNGCPHTGGGLAFSRQGGQPVLHSAVWTGRSGQAGVYYTRSTDLGAEWTKPQALGSEKASHPDLAALPDGTIAAVWDVHGNGSGDGIWTALSSDHGVTWNPPVHFTRRASATHPRVVAAKGEFAVFWTETADTGESYWRRQTLPKP